MDPPTAVKARELARAVIDLRDVCLHDASRWAAEQLKGLLMDDELNQAVGLGCRDGIKMCEIHPDYHLGRQYFEEKEFQRAAHFLKSVPGSRPGFLRCYAMFVAGQKGRDEETVEQYSGLLDPSHVQNAQLESLQEDICLQLTFHPKDPFLLFVYGLVLSDRQKTDEAHIALSQSLHSYPWNWSAWLALQTIAPSIDILDKLDLPDHWMKSFFLAHMSIELQHTQDGLKQLQQISVAFPKSRFVVAECAYAHYIRRNFALSQSLFEDLMKMDPYRLEGIDIYSNILYVKEMSAELSYLAHRAVSTDKYRPETCCIVGNYYSLKGYHKKALLYFQRALKLDSKFLSAWTLMGHEYVEIRNYPAAIDAYRRAVDLNRKDYRAWYGLGQAYEMMQMPSFALYYFRKASTLQPEDARMWNAIGICYQAESINKPDAAISCFERSLNLGDEEGVSVNFLARLYQKSSKPDHAAHYFELSLKRLDDQHIEGKDVVEALTFLAEHYKAQGKFRHAERYCARLMDLGGPERERAKQMMRELRGFGAAWADVDPMALLQA